VDFLVLSELYLLADTAEALWENIK